MFTVEKLHKLNIGGLKKVKDILYKCGKDAGCEEVICEVYNKSVHAKNFYERRGYLVYGTAETLKYNELKMTKKL